MGLGGKADPADEEVAAEVDQEVAAEVDEAESDEFLGLEPVAAPESGSPLPSMFQPSNDAEDPNDLIGWDPIDEEPEEELESPVAEDETADPEVDQEDDDADEEIHRV